MKKIIFNTLTALWAFIFAVIEYQVQRTALCQGSTSCKVWGSFWPFLAVNLIIFFWSVYTLKLRNQWMALIAPIVLAIGIFLTYSFMNTYVRANANSIEISNRINLTTSVENKTRHQIIPYSEIKKIVFRWHLRSRRTSYCTSMTYLALKNGDFISIADYGTFPSDTPTHYLLNSLHIPYENVTLDPSVHCP